MTRTLRDRWLEADDWQVVAGVALGAGLLAVPLVFGPSNTRLVITILIFALFATAYNLLYGYTGLLSFGHAMFIAVAAYAAAKVYRIAGTSEPFTGLFGGMSVLASFLLALLAGMVAAALVGVVIGWFCVQREEIYFALLTLSFSMLIWSLLQQDITGQLAADVPADLGGDTLYRLLRTGGSDGLPVSFRLLGENDLFGVTVDLVDINSYLVYYFVVLAVTALGMYAMWRVVRSPFGETCKAIRENPGRAEALGIDRQFHSWIMFVVSGVFSGLAGAMFVPLRGGALPNMSHWSFSALPVIMTVVGGPYSFLGPALGAFTFEYVRDLIATFAVLEKRWQLVFGLALLGVVLFLENGVAGGLKWAARRFRAWLREARERYRADGLQGVGAFVVETVVARVRVAVATVLAWFRWFVGQLVELARWVVGLVGGLFRAVRRRVAG